MNKEETIIINDELFYRIPNGTSYDYAPIPKEFKPYFERLQQENKELHNKIDKAIDVIHTQMKNNTSYKENLKIIENNLIKGSCKVCDLKDSDVDE